MPVEERRADKVNREKAEGEIAELGLSDKWAKPVNAGNGRIRLKHESGVTVEGNEFSLYAVVTGGNVAGYGYKLGEAIRAVESSAETVEEPKAAEESKAAEDYEVVLDEAPVEAAPSRWYSKPSLKKKGK